jgi:retron-type reverse transcriptase
LAKLLYIENNSLFAIINNPAAFYRTFEIKKKSGGMREIRAPYPSLKTIQQWIYEYVLKNQYVHGCAHGFRTRRSIVTNVKTHVENKCLLKLDLKDFFPSIKINRVVQVFKNIGYTKNVSWLLATVCCLDEELPQGAPTSPALSNIVARHMDKRLYRLAKSFGYRYSRYADDISFSGDDIPVAFIKYATAIIEDCGFAVNEKKVRLYKEQDNKILTGVALRNGMMRLPREKRRGYEQEIYYMIKYGIGARPKGNYDSFSTYIRSLIGKANFWLMLEPGNKFAKEAIPRLRALITVEA